MRQLITGMVAAAAVLTVNAAPASACGGFGLFSSCSPCGASYVSSCGGFWGGFGDWGGHRGVSPPGGRGGVLGGGGVGGGGGPPTRGGGVFAPIFLYKNTPPT